MKGRVDEVWAAVAAVSAARSGSGSGTEWAVVDEEGLAQIAQILSEQQTGLTHLTKIVREMMKDLAVVFGEPGSWTSKEDTPFNPSSTFRASSFRS